MVIGHFLRLLQSRVPDSFDALTTTTFTRI